MCSAFFHSTAVCFFIPFLSLGQPRGTRKGNQPPCHTDLRHFLFLTNPLILFVLTVSWTPPQLSLKIFHKPQLQKFLVMFRQLMSPKNLFFVRSVPSPLFTTFKIFLFSIETSVRYILFQSSRLSQSFLLLLFRHLLVPVLFKFVRRTLILTPSLLTSLYLKQIDRFPNKNFRLLRRPLRILLFRLSPLLSHHQIQSQKKIRCIL